MRSVVRMKIFGGILCVLNCVSLSLAQLPDGVLRKRHLNSRNDCKELHLEILVSPLVGKSELRAIEIQWEFAPKQNGDWIGLFPADPFASHSNPPLLWSAQIYEEHGWVKTEVMEQHLDAEELGFQARCLNYYAAYFDVNNRTLTATCLRLEPTWMWDIRPEIGNKRIRSLFIPGSHDSAAYGEHDENIGDTRVKKYAITQDETVLGQLIYGVRYIDLRVGHYPSNREEFWGNHGIAKLHPLRIIFRDIRQFLNNTQEIVLLDVQEFPAGFDKIEVHRKFVRFLADELGQYFASPTLGYESTLNEVWRTGKRLIIGYDQRQMVSESFFLWPPVDQKWGNVQKLPALYNYIAAILERPPLTAWSAMAELTPTTLDVILDRFKGLRVASEKVNHNLTEWYHSQDWNQKTNIVSVDFFRGSGIVRAAIAWNKFHGVCHKNF